MRTLNLGHFDKKIVKIDIKKSGIIPWNPEEVNFSMFLPSIKYK